MPFSRVKRVRNGGAGARLSAWCRRVAGLLLLPALALPAIALAADPQVAAFVDSPDPVVAGATYTYAVRVDNNTVDAATNARLELSVPSGASFVSASPASQNCVATSATLVTCSLGTLGAGGTDTRNIVFTWRATVPGLAVINATATVSADSDSNTGNSSQTAETTVTSGANLGLSMTSFPGTVVAGSDVTYALVASNTGPNASGDIVITTVLSPSVVYVAAGGTGWSCSNSGQTVTCSRAGPHAVGAAIPQVNVQGRTTATSGTITSSASVAPASGGTPDPDTSNNTASADTNITPGADVQIAGISVSSGTPATAGSAVSFLIQPRNGGPSPAVTASVTDTLPAGWTLVSASGPNWSCTLSGQTATCTRAAFAVGTADDIVLVATAPNAAAVGPSGSSYTHTAQITTATVETDPSNNSRSVNVTVLPDGADLRISKTKTPNPVAQGATLTSTVTVSNNGPRTATGTLRVVELLAGETYVGASGSGWACSASGSVVTCNHANAGGLAVGSSLPALVISSTATATGTLTNTACTGGSIPGGAAPATASPPAEGDPNTGNDCASASALSSSANTDLSISKTTSTPTGTDKVVSSSEAAVTYTLVVTNASTAAEPATGIFITDTVPAYIASRTTINPVTATVSAGTATFNCAVATDTVTCTQTGGNLAQGQTVTVPITVNRPLLEGTFTNTAAVINTVEGDPVSGNNSASDTVTIAAVADVEMTGKSVTPASVRAGENATYVLSYRNNGPSQADGVVVTDTLNFAGGDPGFTVVSISSSKSGSTCSNSAGALLTPAANSFTCTIGSLANGQNESITLVVRPATASGNTARTVANTASITTTSVENPAGGNNGNNSQSTSLTITPGTLDLLVNVTDAVDPVPYQSGSTFLSYTVHVTSNGPSLGSNVRVAETMTPPSGRRVRFVCDTTTAGGSTCNTVSLCTATNTTSAAGVALPVFSCNVPAGNSSTGAAVGELVSGQSKDVFLRFEVLDGPAASGDVFSLSSTVSANETDSFTSNNTAVEATTTRQQIDLRVTKTASAATVSLREPFNWTIAVQNRGPGDSARTDFTDTLPAGTELTGTPSFSRTLPAGSGNCTVSGLVVSCSLGVLSANGVATVTIPVRIASYPVSGSLTNSATVDNDPAKTGAIDVPGNNNNGSATVNVTRSSISGTVFEDRDRSGSNGGVPQAAGSEPRLAGVAIRLTGTDAYGNAVDQSTTTDSNGDYGFTDLSPAGAAGYTLTQTQPTAYANSPVNVPSSGGSAPSVGGSYAAGGAGNSSYTALVLPAATAATRYNFPELRQPSLSGFVYIDLNSNSTRDAASDTPIAGATVRLLNASTGATVASTSTDSTGAYSFTGLDPTLLYTLEQPLPSSPANLGNGPVNPGLVNGLACSSGCTAQPDTPAANTDRIASIDLSQGLDGTLFNFGERQLAATLTSISGLVFIDSDGDTNRGGSEPALAGVTFRLVQGADCTTGSTLQTTTSASDGSWRFDNVLSGGNYLVCETQPAGYGTGSANGTVGSNQISITALPIAGSSGHRFGETLSSVSGAVYADFDATTASNTNNGLRDSGEAGIAGVTLTLTGRDISGAAVSRTTTTDSSGNYSFTGLLQSDATGYSISEGSIPPTAGSFNDGRDTAASAGGSTAVNDVLSGIVLAAGSAATGYNFGELPQATVSGTVYVDRNRNGGIDASPSDGRIAGVTLTLYPGSSCSGTAAASTTTDASGNYSIGAASAGLTYTVCQTQPAGYADGQVNAGTNGSSSAANSITITALPLAGSPANHFGERVGAIAGAVYLDSGSASAANTNNGLRDSGEVGIAGVTISLTGRDISGTAVSRTTTTDSSGNYRFDDLLQSDATGYTVSEGSIPSAAGSFSDGRDTAGSAGGSTAVNDVISAIVLGAGVVAIDNNFGELPVATPPPPPPATASIGGTVYVDRNRSGGIDATPTDGRIAGVTLTLYPGSACTGTAAASTTSDASGNYSFDGLTVGQTYTVCQTQPAAYGDGPVNAGTSASSGAANSLTITALPSTGSSGNHFGELVAALSGAVYVDSSPATPANTNNGLRDSGEAGIAGVTITLTGRDITGAAVSRTTTTDSNGNYSFADLLQSDATGYTLSEGAIPSAAGTFNDGRDTAGSVGGSTAANDVIGAIVLPAGSLATGYNFGELPVAAPPPPATASISGTVYVDRNRSGGLDATPTDGRIAGVTLTLYPGSTCSGTAAASTSSDASGNYSFDGLTVGQTYTVCQTQPAGYGDGQVNAGTSASSSAANSITISTLPSTGSSGNHFGERLGSIAGAVYADVDGATAANTNNGLRDSGEAGIAGVTITLTGRDIAGGSVSRTTTTDSNGNYSFADLLQSDATGYTLSEGSIPSAAGSFNDGRDTAGSVGGSTAANDVISAIVLPAGSQATGYNFGELPVASISGTVYIDRNRNGGIDATPTDGRIAGVTLTLYPGSSCSGTAIASTTTDASGNYSFATASAGLTYTVCQTQPAGYADGQVNLGSGGSSTAANSITLTALPAGGSTGNQFGERLGSIAGAVYLDANHDGIRQSAEIGFAGVTLTLAGTDATGAAVSRSTSTDASGNYRFDDLLAANAAGYTVTEQAAQPVTTGAGGNVTTLNGRSTAGTVASATVGTASGLATLPSRISAITLAAGADGLAYNFGEILPSTVSGQVFTDGNNNGQRDAPADAGIPGVTIVLTGTDDTGAAVSITVTTGADGSFSIPDLRPGTYTLTQPSQPGATSNGITTPGAVGGTATPQGTAPSAISGIVIGAPGTVASGNLFAEVPTTSAITGQVWLDANNNGSQDGSEAGIAGVTLTLTGTDVAGRPVSASTTTAASGAYRFDSLAPGSYTVTEPTQPAGTLDGASRVGSSGGSTTAKGSTPSVLASITVGAGVTATGYDFGEVPVAQITGRVYADNNNNGSVDASESGIANVALQLTGTDDLGRPVGASTSTGSDGSFAFTTLRPGTYTVTEPTQPSGTQNGITSAGVLGGTATAVATTPSAISGIVLPPGATASGNLFGEIGQSPDLRVAESHNPATFTVGQPGSLPITVRNAGEVATSGAYTADGRLPTGVTLSALPSGPGWACTGSVGASSFSCSSSTVLAPGATHPGVITVPVAVAATAVPNSPVSVAVLVDGGGELDARRPSGDERSAFNSNPAALPQCQPAIVHNACRDAVAVQLPASVSGTVWLDSGSNARLLDAGDRRLPGWLVEVLDTASNQVVGRATTAADGSYRVADLLPGTPLAVRFRDPQANVVFGYPINGDSAPGASGAACANGAPAAGAHSSCVGTGASPQLAIVLAAGQNLPQQSLPVDPSGVVYDAVQRSAVPGAVVTLSPVGACAGWDAANHIVGATLGGYTVAGSSVAMTVGANGFYQFLLAPSAPARCTFALSVTPPAGYAAPSSLIPATAGPLVPAGGVGSVYAVQPQATPPSGAVGTATTYYLQVVSGSAGANIVHNHIPLDPALPTALSLSKTGDKARAEVGDSVRYTITVAMPAGPRPVQTTVIDRLPAGFTYIPGTATVNDQRIADPAGAPGPSLAFQLGTVPADGRLVLRYRVRVGVGAQQGDGINRAQAHSCTSAASCVGAGLAPLAGVVSSNEGRHQVTVGGGVFGVEACVLGKVFVDCNGNHVQDREELGIPGVRLMLSDGTTLVSDSEGKYSVCGLPPRGHVLKVDPLTLPRGSRLTTSSNRNLGDAGSLWLDLKNGELHRADFIEGSCSNTVLEQTKARRAQGEVRAPEAEGRGPALRFDSKAHGLDTLRSPQQGTDSSNQPTPQPRLPAAPPLPSAAPPPSPPTPAASAAAQGAPHGTR